MREPQDESFDGDLTGEQIHYLSSVTRPTENGERFKLIREVNMIKTAKALKNRPVKVT